MPNPWISHLKAFYAKNKSKMSYAQAMKAARASYRPKGAGKAGKAGKAEAPKRKRGRKKKRQS
jgi:hypothetical protein